MEAKGRLCSEPGCEEPGEFRAPPLEGAGARRDGPTPYRWLCLDHVREFNAGYNFFKGMSTEEIHEAQRPFAGWANIRPAPGVEPWTDNVSHGELIRDGIDQTMTVDPARLRFVFQGLLDEQKAGLDYGRYPWRIGILTPARDGG